jgi:hypothetical protein
MHALHERPLIFGGINLDTPIKIKYLISKQFNSKVVSLRYNLSFTRIIAADFDSV